MLKQFYSVHASLSDGHSSLSLGYAVSIDSASELDQELLEKALLDNIAVDQGFTFNGEYYETVGYCSVKLTSINPISENDFNVISKVFKSLVVHVSYEFSKHVVSTSS